MSIIPFDKREGKIWFNGEMVDWQDATIHVLNHGLHYGSCVFEGIAVYNRKIFKLKEHTERLIKSAKMLGFSLQYNLSELMEATEEVVKAQDIQDGYIRPVAWRGSEKMAISAQNNKIHVAIAAWTWPPYYSKEAKKEGVKLIFADYKRPSPDTAPTAAKAAGLYMICTISKHFAEDKGYNDALMLDYRGYIAEGCSANIFFVKGNELHTPVADCFLNGITRQTVIEIARNIGIKVVERHIKPEELSGFDDAFLTGTAAEVTRIREIYNPNGDLTYNYAVNDLTLDLMNNYYKLVNN